MTSSQPQTGIEPTADEPRRKRPSEASVRRTEAINRTPTALLLGIALLVIGVIVLGNGGNALVVILGIVLLAVGLIQRTIIQTSQRR